MSQARISRAQRSTKWGGGSLQVRRPLCHGHADLVLNHGGIAFVEPGIKTRSVPSLTVRWRAIQVVVISAATVIRSTATSQVKGTAISPSVCRNAGSASRP